MLFPSESSVYSSGHLQQQSKQQSRILAFYSLAKSQKVFAEIQAQAKKKEKFNSESLNHISDKTHEDWRRCQ